MSSKHALPVATMTPAALIDAIDAELAEDDRRVAAVASLETSVLDSLRDLAKRLAAEHSAARGATIRG